MREPANDEQSSFRGANATDTIPALLLPLLLTEEYWTDRGRFLADSYCRFGPLFRARQQKTEVVFMIGPAANRFVMATERRAFSHTGGWNWVFGGSPGLRNLLTMDPPEHDLHRRILNPAFGVPRLPTYAPLITGVVHRRLARWAQRGEIDAYEESRLIAFDLAVRAFLGIQPGPENELARAVYLHGAHGRQPAYTSLLRRKIAERRSRPVDDALGLLAVACDMRGLPFDEEQILAHAEILLLAGYETTASMGAWALYLLAAHPQYVQRLRDEISAAGQGTHPDTGLTEAVPLLEQFVLEAERLYPPVPTAPRRLLDDVHYAGHHLPAGTLVLHSAAGTHMLPDIWSEPGAFDPGRFAPGRAEHRRTPYALIGFGGGARTCIGQPFARLQLRTLLARAAQLYDLAPLPGQVLRQHYNGVTAGPAHGIRLRVVSRS